VSFGFLACVVGEYVARFGARKLMNTDLKLQIKQMLVENLMLQVTAEEIGDDQPLFGPGSLGLDSVDALQLVVALEKNYGVKISDPQMAKKTLQTVNNIAETIQQKQ